MTAAPELVLSTHATHPIVFSTPMVNAIRAGVKTQTRRILTVPWKGATRALPYSPWYDDVDGKLFMDCSEASWSDGGWYEASEAMHCPYGRVGDHLWVRETWAALTGNGVRVVYKADGDPPLRSDKTPIVPMKWNSSRFMPRTASRLTLRVESIRVERLQKLTEEDAKAEGVESWETLRAREYPSLMESQTMTTGERMLDCPHRASFAMLWDKINGDRFSFAGLWKGNPWVWVVGFSLHSTHKATFPGVPPFKSKRRPTPAKSRRSRSTSAR